MKRKNQKSQRRSPPKKVVRKDSPTQKFAYWGIAGFLIIIVVTLLVVALRNNSSEMTGSSVSVKYYGLSDFPLSKFAGEMQTDIFLKQPTLGNLKTAAGATEVAREITAVVDFADGVVSAYQNAPLVSIPPGGLDAVMSTSKHAEEYFLRESTCLTEVGNTYGYKDEMKLVLVSELVYKGCSNYPNWRYAFLRHSYYTEEGKFICSQEAGKLFAVDVQTGRTVKNTEGC